MVPGSACPPRSIFVYPPSSVLPFDKREGASGVGLGWVRGTARGVWSFVPNTEVPISDQFVREGKVRGQGGAACAEMRYFRPVVVASTEREANSCSSAVPGHDDPKLFDVFHAWRRFEILFASLLTAFSSNGVSFMSRSNSLDGVFRSPFFFSLSVITCDELFSWFKEEGGRRRQSEPLLGTSLREARRDRDGRKQALLGH